MYTKHQWKTTDHFNFKYVLNLPKGYDPNEKYPLVIFLHGAGERGDDLDLAVRHGYMKHVREENKEYPFLFVAPQCPENKFWGCYTESLLAFIDYICKKYPVDIDRVYLTGLSMGGTGTWMLAMAAPDKFAAIAPICGSGIIWNTAIISKIPIFVYHGDCDFTVPIQESMNMITGVNKNGGNAQMKICYGVGHNAWDYAYKGDELASWMLSHTRKKKME